MRSMRYTREEPLIVRAAHSRTIHHGDVVDFDERVFAGNGSGYSLEQALSDDVKHFAPHFEPVEAAVVIAEAETVEAIKPAKAVEHDAKDDDAVDIVALNAKEAAVVIAEAETVEALDVLSAAEQRRDGGARISVMRAIEARGAELAPPVD